MSRGDMPQTLAKRWLLASGKRRCGPRDCTAGGLVAAFYAYDVLFRLHVADTIAAWGMILQIDASQFDREVTASALPVLVEFFTDQCFHCEQALPILAKIAAERSETLRVFKFNAGEDPRFASQFRIVSVPNFVLFRNGAPIGQRTGFAAKRELLAWVDSANPNDAALTPAARHRQG